MFLLCYIGDLLIEKVFYFVSSFVLHVDFFTNFVCYILFTPQSTNVGISCCMIDWYRLPAKTVQDLILIIAMSNTPAKISAGRIVDLSLLTFGNVCFHKYFNSSVDN